MCLHTFASEVAFRDDATVGNIKGNSSVEKNHHREFHRPAQPFQSFRETLAKTPSRKLIGPDCNQESLPLTRRESTVCQ